MMSSRLEPAVDHIDDLVGLSTWNFVKREAMPYGHEIT